MAVTQQQIAQRLGLSSQSVRLALSDRPEMRKQIRPETRQRILQAVREAGYVPHHAARRLAQSRSKDSGITFDQVGLLYITNAGNFVDAVCHGLMDGAEVELSHHDTSLTFTCVRRDKDWEKVWRLMRSARVDGWLLVGSVNDEAVAHLQEWGQSYVVLGDHRCTEPQNVVNIDHEQVGKLAARHFAAGGHTRVAMVTGSMQFNYQVETVNGFKAELKRLGVKLDADAVMHAVNPQAQAIADWLRALRQQPTAIFASESDGATQTISACRLLGYDVPGRVSVLGCELGIPGRSDQDHARVVLPITQMGTSGAALLSRIVAESRSDVETIQITPAIVNGWSSGMLPQALQA